MRSSIFSSFVYVLFESNLFPLTVIKGLCKKRGRTEKVGHVFGNSFFS